MRILDLYCGAGGAGAGYARAGFEVVGVDLEPQPFYPFSFIQGDALEALELVDLGGFVAIHASPPCQRYTTLRVMANHRADHPDLVEPTRAALEQSGLPWVIENVPGAPLTHSVMLCGSMFGLGAAGRELRRHRLFETSFPLLGPTCQHRGPVIGFYGDHARSGRRGRTLYADGDRVRLAQEALEMPWVPAWRGLAEAIPPAYTELIGHALRAAVRPGVVG